MELNAVLKSPAYSKNRSISPRTNVRLVSETDVSSKTTGQDWEPMEISSATQRIENKNVKTRRSERFVFMVAFLSEELVCIECIFEGVHRSIGRV